MDKKFYVYEWYIVNTGEVFYVGKGSGRRYRSLNQRNKFFLDMVQTHDCKSRIVQNNLTESEAFELEKQMIQYYRKKTSYRLTNVTDGGEGSSGYVPSDEVRQKMSIASKEKWKDPKFREKMIAKRNAADQSYQSQAFREKMSSLTTGEHNPNYGHFWTQQQKEHLSKVRKDNKLAKGVNNPRATKIICLETGEIFDLIQYAVKHYHKSEGCFSVALQQRWKTAAGLHWMVYDPRLEDESERFYELLISLSLSVAHTPIICVETQKIYANLSSFCQELNLSLFSTKKKLQQIKEISIGNYHYMCVKEYLQVAYSSD